jgi:RNA polymerase sigma-70 factor (ECF subfamily)
MDLGPAGTASSPVGAPRPEPVWVMPVSDSRVLPEANDPADVAVARESIRLAFITALQHLPPRQRAVLILREVLCWPASDVAELLETTVASVNSALQRARATLADVDPASTDVLQPDDEAQRDLLARYVAAFEQYDMESLTRLLHEDATLSMPPLELWLRGPAEIGAWFLGTGIGCKGSRLIPTAANGSPAFGQYRPAPEGGHKPWALIILEIADGRIIAQNSFLDTEHLFPLFGLPASLPAQAA